MLKWEQLLNSETIRGRNKVEGDSRSPFENDYDRIIYCTAFRRLQHKAQVFPLEQFDYVRNRLTHSLEVSTLCRSFGKDVGEKLYQKGVPYFLENRNSINYLSSILSSAALVHDIGNPPFGHFGEEAIRAWFTDWFLNNTTHINIKDEEKLDLCKFEGNAQALRIISKLQFLIDINGLNLTFATLASLIKYPRSSSDIFRFNSKGIVESNLDRVKANNVSYKKFGYFTSEDETFSKVKIKTDISTNRHPLAFLLEAADDIANSASDIEDAFKKSAITYEEFRTELKEELGDEHGIIKKMDDYYSEAASISYPEPESIVIQRLRVYLQGNMFRSCVSSFINNYNDIINGDFKDSLISQTGDDYSKIYKILTEKIAPKYVYKNKSILMMELVGNKVICGLLDIFVPAILSDRNNTIKSAMGKYYELISPNFKFIFEDHTSKSYYNRLQLATDFICGMTDTYALDLYQKLSGVRLL